MCVPAALLRHVSRLLVMTGKSGSGWDSSSMRKSKVGFFVSSMHYTASQSEEATQELLEERLDTLGRTGI